MLIRAIQNTKTKEFFPIDGWMGTASVYHFESGKNSFDLFIRGIGLTKAKTKDFLGHYISPLRNKAHPFVKEYCEKYGKHVTTSQLSQWMAGICVEGYFYSCLSCKVSKEFSYEFAEKFKRDVFDFKDCMLGVFGLFSFNLSEFDDWLHSECGYRESRHGSMNNFLIKKFGTGFAERFKNELIKKL